VTERLGVESGTCSDFEDSTDAVVVLCGTLEVFVGADLFAHCFALLREA
jgi:hypothetical protein